MNSKSLFAVCVRVVGLVSLLYVLASMIGLIGVEVPWLLAVKEILWFILSVWLLRGAPALVRFAYSGED